MLVNATVRACLGNGSASSTHVAAEDIHGYGRVSELTLTLEFQLHITDLYNSELIRRGATENITTKSRPESLRDRMKNLLHLQSFRDFMAFVLPKVLHENITAGS